MTQESLFNDIYLDICTNDYCSICFRTCNERRLLNGKNLAKFKFFRQSNNLEVSKNIEKFCNQKVCYMCDAQAMAANRFCVAVNLSHHIHSLFYKMKKQPNFFTEVKDHLTNGGKPGELLHNLRNVEDLQEMLKQCRRNTTLLQTETLMLNNPGDECPEEPPNAPPTNITATARETLRDLLTFESQPGIDDDDTIFGLDAPEIDKQIIIEDDDPIKQEPPDQNMFIIPDKLPTVQADTQTDNTAGYFLHPIIVENGTLTIPSLDKNISIDRPGDIVNGLANNTNNNSRLNHFVVLPQTKTQIVGTNSNQNTSNLNFIRNTNSVAQDIVSLVKNPTSGQKTLNLLQNNSNLNHQAATLERHTVSLLPNPSNLRQNTITVTQRANAVQNMSSAIENTLNLPNIPPTQAVLKKVMPVRVTASPVKWADSDSDTNCQNIQPLRKPEGKIDWEDKIPMDVISFVSPSDPTTMTAKRQKTGSYLSGLVTSADHDPMDKCVITDVKSVRELEIIDLC